MNICKLAYRIVRSNSDEIYKGFGFRHLSDATQYYVHPNNQSFKGTTTLCQPIGEGISLFCSMLDAIMHGDMHMGDYCYCENQDEVFVDIKVPDDWRENGVVDWNIHGYKAWLSGFSMSITAYDNQDMEVPGNMEHLHPLYKYLPMISALMAYEMEHNLGFKNMVLAFLENPAADTFVNIHEDLYQAHKFDEFNVTYGSTWKFEPDAETAVAFSSNYKTICENLNSEKIIVQQERLVFEEDRFLSEYRSLIPVLGKEFILQKSLQNLCNAIVNGDICTILFHGPAGTGKTMSCKLIAQFVKMPIMETINCTENLDEFVLGKYIPQDDKIIFKESYVTKAIRYGGAVVFEEINFAKPQYLAFLNSLLDDNGFVRLDTGEVVKRHKDFRFFATMNIGYFGTKELNQALYNRFHAIVEAAELSDEAIRRMLTIRVPECIDYVEKVLSVYHKIKKMVESQELDIVISPRNLENWVRLAKYEGYIQAAEKTIIPIAKCDRILERSIRSILHIYRWRL